MYVTMHFSIAETFSNITNNTLIIITIIILILMQVKQTSLDPRVGVDTGRSQIARDQFFTKTPENPQHSQHCQNPSYAEACAARSNDRRFRLDPLWLAVTSSPWHHRRWSHGS